MFSLSDHFTVDTCIIPQESIVVRHKKSVFWVSPALSLNEAFKTNKPLLTQNFTIKIH